jgi:hypothetical protein
LPYAPSIGVIMAPHTRFLTVPRLRTAKQARVSFRKNVRATSVRAPSLAGLRDRMMCPRCGNRRVNLIFEPPPVATRAPVA